jgi:hydroxyacylglutathione hydrolase
MHSTPFEVSAIKAFSDNYIWLLRGHDNACAVVDPGDEEPVLETLAAKGLDLRYILLTHHHPDHTGGVRELKKNGKVTVFGPDDTRMPFVDQVCRENDRVRLPELNADFRVIEVPAHTSSHIAFFGNGVVFSGDTLFSLGCGRFFEGTPEDMQRALDKLAALPPETENYCAHEYTQSNGRFALAVEPDNQALLARTREVEQLRNAGRMTLPSTIGDELAANPFMRTREPAVVAAARQRQADATSGVSTMAVIRAWKDRF